MGGLTPGATYYAIRIGEHLLALALTRQDASAGRGIDLTPGAGGSRHGLVTDTFVSIIDASQTTPVVDYDADTIELKGHGLTTGQQIDYDNVGDDPIGGLTKGSYLVIVVDADHIRLAYTSTPNDPINLLPGLLITGWQQFLVGNQVYDFDPLQQPTVGVNSDTIWMRNHGFTPGERVTYLAGGGTPIGGLIDGHEYLVLPGTDENNFRLADPSAPQTPLNLTGPGSGTQGFERVSNAYRGTSPIGGLLDGGTYYVTRIDADHIRLSATLENALNAGPIDLSLTAAQRANPELAHRFSTTGGNAGISVLASLTADNSAITDSQVGGSPTLSHILLGYFPLDPMMLAKTALGQVTVVGDPAPISISGSSALNGYVHQVQAVVGSGAVLKSDAGVTVDASSENYSRVIANGKVITPNIGGQLVAVGVATALGSFDNTVLATVEQGAVIDAAAAVKVNAELAYPDLTKFLPFNPDRFAIDDPDNGNWMTELGTALNGRGGLDQMFNVWANASSTTAAMPGKGSVTRPAMVSVTGSYSSAAYRNVVEALIASGALINQTTRADGQFVSVSADSTMDLLNLAGVIKLELDPTGVRSNVLLKSSPVSLVGNQASWSGVGGSALTQSVESRTIARIEGGAKVHTGTGAGGGLEVAATENVSSVNIAQSGGSSGVIGLSGSVSLVDHVSTTHAELGSGIRVSGGPVSVESRSDITYDTIAGAVLVAGAVGIGASGAVNRVTRDTAAIIGTGPGTARTVIDATGLSLEARNTGTILGASVAGAIADQGTAAQTSGPIPTKLPVSVGVAGAVGINEVNESTRSYLVGDAVVTLAHGDLTLDSRSDTRILAVTGSLSLAARNLVSIALAGSLSQNSLDMTTESYLDGTQVADAGAVSLNAQRQGSVFAVTIAAAGTAPSPFQAYTPKVGITVDVAASVSLNSIGGATRAFIDDSSVQARDAVSLTATDSSRITADGGGVAIALGLTPQAVGVTIAAGASVTLNEMTSTVAAYLDDARVGGGDITIAAENSSTIDAVTVAGAAIFSVTNSVGLAFDGAGAGSGNRIHNTIEAYVQDSTVLAGNLAVRAEDDSEINARSIAAAIALQLGGTVSAALSMGGSATINEVGNGVHASIDRSVVTAADGIDVTAIATSNIAALSVGAAFATAASSGGVAVAGAGAGAYSSNSISNDVSASIVSSSVRAGPGGVVVQADDTSTIVADADGGALAISASSQVGIGVAVGAVIAENEVANTVSARVDASGIISGGGVVVASISRNHSETLAVAVAASVGAGFPIGLAASGAGGWANNTIRNTVESAVMGASMVTADGNVQVVATDTSSVDATVAAAAGASGIITIATGLSLTSNTIDNRVTAYVDGSHVTSAHGDLAIAANAASDVSALSVGIAAAYPVGLAAAGATADSTILSTVDAHARDATLSSSGATRILAGSDSNAGASVAAVGVGLIGISVLKPTVHIGGSTRAFVDGTSTVTAAGLDVHATSVNEALLPTGLSLAISAIGGAGAGARAEVSHTTEAYVGDNSAAATVIDAGAGKVSIEATSTSIATSEVTGGAIAGVNIGAFLSTATIEGATKAHVGPSATVRAGALDIHATSTETATAHVTPIGVGLIGGTGANANASITTVTEAYAGAGTTQVPATAGPRLVVQNAVDIAASSFGIAEAEARGGGGGGLQVTALLANARNDSRTRAFVGEKAAVTAGSLTVEADGHLSATAETFVIAIGAITGTGASATATVGSSDASQGTVEAFIGRAPGTPAAAAATTITAEHGVVVQATTDARASASASGGTGGAIDVSAMLATANENTVTRADVSDGVNLNAGSLDVIANATHRLASADLNVTQVSLLAGGSGINARAGVNGTVEASAGGPTSRLTTGGRFAIRAETGDAFATSTSELGAGGIINVAVALADAVNRGTTSASVRGGTQITAGSVEVRADSNDRAAANAFVAGGGAVSGQGVKAQVSVTPTNKAHVGNDVRIASAGDVSVTALARTARGNANASSIGGGAIIVGVGVAELTVSPTVTANIDGGTTITAGGDLTVAADLMQPQAAPGDANLDDTFQPSTAVDVTADTIHFVSHGLQTGDVVTYDADGNNPINTSGGPLVSLTRDYSVIRVDNDTLALGETFAGTAVDAGVPFDAASGVDAARDVISFGRPHNFKSGDAVRYDSGGLTSVGGLTDDPGFGGIYYVRVIDDRTIKLTRTKAEAMAVAPRISFIVNTPGLISGDTLHIANNGYAAGDRVTYHAPSWVAFNSKSVDYDNANTEAYTTADNDIIYLGADVDGDGTIEPLATNLRTGDKVTYLVDVVGRAIGGLVNGQTYYVIKLNDFQIRLAATADLAASNTHIPLSADKSDTGVAVRHRLVPQALGGLQDGVTYTVFNPTASSFQLKDAAGNIVAGLSLNGATGTHFFSEESGIDLAATSDSASAGHSLRFDFISPLSSGTNKLLGPGGISLRTFNPDVASGPSTASARGGAFGFAAFSGPSAHATFGANVQAGSAAALLDVTGDVSITSHSDGSVTALADTKGGGFIGVSVASATVDYVNTNTAFVGTPVGNVSGITSEAAAPQVTAGGMRIRAGGDFLVGSTSELTASARASALGAGFIGVADSHATTRVTSYTNALIGSGADIQARSVAVNAQVTGLQAFADASATAGGFAGGAGATADNAIRSTTNALLEGTGASRTRIDAREGMDVHATHDDVILFRRTFTKWYGLFGGTSDRGDTVGELKNTADGDAGVRIFAGPRPSASTSGAVPPTPLDALPLGSDRVAVFVQANNRSVTIVDNGQAPENDHVNRTVNDIRWDSDITVYAGPAPELVIGPDGRVVRAVNVTVNGLSNPAPGTDFSDAASISVGDIKVQSPGQIVFQATNKIAGSGGTFHFSDGYESVRITNASDKDLVLHTIDLTPVPPVAPRVLRDQDVGTPTLTFVLVEELLPTDVEVRNLGTSNLVLPDGQRIDNVAGSTQLLNLGGDIQTGPNGTFVIRTQRLGDPLKPTANPAFSGLAPGLFDGAVRFVDNGAASDTITRTDGGSWVAAGFQIGGLIQVEGSLNAGVYKIAGISGANQETLTLHALDSLVTATGAARVTRFQGIEAASGSIGSTANPIRIVLVKGDGQSENLYAAASGDVFLHLTGEFPTDDPANTLSLNTITAGGNVEVTLDQVVDPTFVFGLIEAGGGIRLQAANAGVPGATGDPARINVHGIIDLLGSGHLDVLTNGDIVLAELTGDLRVGTVSSTAGDVTLTAPSAIIGVGAGRVTGVNINLTGDTSGGGAGIGSSNNLLETDLLDGGHSGVLTAGATGSIFIREVQGDLRVNTIVSAAHDVVLQTLDGSILDRRLTPAASPANVFGESIDLVAAGGGIGDAIGDLLIDSSTAGVRSGRLYATADRGTTSAGDGVYITEVANELNVLGASSRNGDIRLTVPDLATAGQNLNLLAGGSTLSGSLTTSSGFITAGNNVLLQVGDNVTTTNPSRIVAGHDITVHGDFGNADSGVGTTMDLRGTITPGGGATDRTAFFGNLDNDTFTFNQTFLGGQTFAYGSSTPSPAGDDGTDTFTVNQLRSMETARPLVTPDHGDTVRRDTLDLDGQAGTDIYTVNTTGGQVAAPSDYVINVLDTGANNDGADTLTINGSDQADLFLLRRANYLTGRPSADSPAFVALLHGTADQAVTHTLDPHVERVNYDAHINGGLVVRGLGGDDTFASDDNSALTTLDSGAGNDSFQIGQLFGTARVPADVAAGDEFDTTLTTRGYLSRGVSFATVANGGAGDDTFSVYSNKAGLRLNGDDGNDSFTIRSFALADQSGASAAIPVLYNLNAPAAIDGGNGFDEIAVLGTEFGDNLVVTDTGVFGAGVNASYASGEALEVNGLEGDDNFFILSTSAVTATAVVGHLGTDTYRVAGDVTLPIVSTDDPAGPSPLKSFPLRTHVTSQIRGPLDVEGSTGGRPDRALATAVILPTETDSGPHSINLPPVDEANSIDRLNVFNDGSATNDIGTLTGTNLSGLGTAGDLTQNTGTDASPVVVTTPGGITYHDFEILDVLLGTGDDTLTIHGTMTPDGVQGGITVVHGGAGGDTVAVRPAAGSASATVTLASPLVIYGDTSQDGSEYNDAPGTPTPYARHFAVIPGNNRDTIDARASLTGLAIYGGLDNDVIYGSQGGDYLAGGSGDDAIHGNGGNDIIYGDSGFNAVFVGEPGFPVGADRNTRGVAVPTVNASVSATPATAGATGHAPNSDSMVAGHDTITGGDADDIIFGDHGVVTQTTRQAAEAPGTLRLVNPGAGKRIETTADANGVSDIIDGGTGNDFTLGGSGGDTITDATGENVLFGDFGYVNLTPANTASPIDSMGTLDPALGGDDVITAGLGDTLHSNTIFGGSGHDAITAGSGPNNIVFGDGGEVISAPAVNGTPNLAAPLDGRLITLGQVGTTDPLHGGNDTITTGTGRDIIFGGSGNDRITANSGETATGPDGNNIVFGDRGYLDYVSADADPRDIDVISSDDLLPPGGGNDTIATGAGNDIILGGAGADVITSSDGQGLVFGDSGKLTSAIGYDAGAPFSAHPFQIGSLVSIKSSTDGGDRITAGSNSDIVIGGAGNDVVFTGGGNDLAFGAYGQASTTVPTIPVVPNSQLPPRSPDLGGTFNFVAILTQNADLQGNPDDDFIDAGIGDDVVLGGQGNDTIYGRGGDDDLIGGHNVAGGSDTGDRIDGGTGNDLIAGDNATILRTADALNPRVRVLSGALIYDADGNARLTGTSQVDPTGAGRRLVTLLDHSTTATAGTSGNDSIAGGANDDMIFGQFGDDSIQGDGSIDLAVSPTVPSADNFAGTDGDDYIEGNGGNDLIHGNLGQDDIIGGSSNLYGLTTPADRPDGSDTIFGGSGTAVGRDHAGDLSSTGHARDADTILGDNGLIFRLVGTNGVAGSDYLAFTYDTYSSTLRIIPRAITLLDYTLGGSTSDLGAADLIHGEAGDDEIHGMTGNDVVFGEGQDDNLIGGAGHDRIYGGTGEDGVVGDDGKIYTSRNGLTETLYGLTAPNAQTFIGPPGPDTGAWVYLTGRLFKTVELTAWTEGGNDVIYGGRGDDFLHAGAGDDAISGAEALPAFYTDAPVTDTDPLEYDPVTRKLAAYDADDPRTKIAGFLLNFEAADGAGQKIDDGKDYLFGDLGHDWLVGGTGKDRLFGGLGDDLHNADDNHDSQGGRNDRPDDPEFADADFVFGGGGLDVLFANTGADRLYDWTGEFNTFLVPFSQFGAPTVNRFISPDTVQFLLELGRSAGSDQTLVEPNGELGLITQQDAGWNDQSGPPRDPQPGTTPGRQDTEGGPEDDRPVSPAANSLIGGSNSGGNGNGSAAMRSSTSGGTLDFSAESGTFDPMHSVSMAAPALVSDSDEATPPIADRTPDRRSESRKTSDRADSERHHSAAQPAKPAGRITLPMVPNPILGDWIGVDLREGDRL